MRAVDRGHALAAFFLLGCAFSFAQLSHSATGQSQSRAIHLDVVATGHNDAPVAGLTQSDFTVLDNGVPQKITSFQPMTGNACPVEIIIVLDTVNPNYSTVAFEREQMDKFFQAHGGKLPYPTALAIFSDRGKQILRGFTQNGPSLADALDHQRISLRAIKRSAGANGAGERLNLSLRLVQRLISTQARMPGRKIILWMSPGWPFMSGPNVELTSRQDQSLFDDVAFLSMELRQNRITFYAINPFGSVENLQIRYQDFLEPVLKPNMMQLGNLSLQVLAVHSGGLVLEMNNDIAGLIQKVMDDVQYFYELAYTPPAGEPDEYHSIKVKIAKPKMKARTTAGYYEGY